MAVPTRCRALLPKTIMQIIINLTPEQEAALSFIAAKGNKPATDTEPEVIVDPETYFRARIDEMLASYGEQMRGEDMQAITIAYKAAPEADKDAVFVALKIERPTAERLYANTRTDSTGSVGTVEAVHRSPRHSLLQPPGV